MNTRCGVNIWGREIQVFTPERAAWKADTQHDDVERRYVGSRTVRASNLDMGLSLGSVKIQISFQKVGEESYEIETFDVFSEKPTTE